MRALKWVSLAVLLAACGNEAGTGEQRSVALPDDQAEVSRDADMDALRGDDTGDASISGPAGSGDWTLLEGAALNEMVDTTGTDFGAGFGGSNSAEVRRDGEMFAILDDDAANREVVVWTAGETSPDNGRVSLSFDIEGVSNPDAWIGVTLAHRSGADYHRVSCAFSPDGEDAQLFTDNAEGEAAASGSRATCTLETDIETGELDFYIYPVAFTILTGWDDSLTGEAVLSNVRVSTRG